MPAGAQKGQHLGRGTVKRKIAGKTERSIVRKGTFDICERHVGVDWQGLLRQSHKGFQIRRVRNTGLAFFRGTQPIESMSAWVY